MPEENKLKIDYTQYEQKLDLDMGRLDDMVHYVNAKGCRQKYLISYFGEDAQFWTCGTCDHCNETSVAARPLNSHEITTVEIILLTVKSFNGKFGRGKLSQMLAGQRSADFV